MFQSASARVVGIIYSNGKMTDLTIIYAKAASQKLFQKCQCGGKSNVNDAQINICRT